MADILVLVTWYYSTDSLVFEVLLAHLIIMTPSIILVLSVVCYIVSNSMLNF